MSGPRGWSNPGTGYYAKGPYRVEGSGKRWRWWHVVQLSNDAPRGTTRSRRDAMTIVDALLAAETDVGATALPEREAKAPP